MQSRILRRYDQDSRYGGHLTVGAEVVKRDLKSADGSASFRLNAWLSRTSYMLRCRDFPRGFSVPVKQRDECEVLVHCAIWFSAFTIMPSIIRHRISVMYKDT